MTKLLERAIERAKRLDGCQQDALAAIILDEIESEAAWDARFAASPDRLAELAAEARREVADGRGGDGDPGDDA